MTPERFREVADHFTEPALLVTQGGAILAGNRAVEELGWSPDSLPGRRLADLTPANEVRVDAYLRACVRTGGVTTGTFDLLRSDGAVVPSKCHGSRVAGQSEEPRILLRCAPSESSPSHFAALNQKVEELTEQIRRRQLAEAATQDSEQRFRALMEQAPFSIQVFSPDGRTVRVNRFWEDPWGVTLDQIADYNILQDPQLAAKAILPFLERAFAGEAVIIPPILYDPDQTLPDRSRHADARRWVSAVAYPLRDSSGRIREVVLVHDDITARRRAEEALAESEQRFRLLADTIPQLAWMAQPDGHIFWYNRRWYEYTGTAEDQMAGWGWQSVHHPDTLPAVMEQWRGSLASGEPFDMVFPLRGADGSFRPFLTRVNPLRDETGRVLYWFGTNTDISAQKRSEDASRFLADASAALAAVGDLGSTLQKVASLAIPRFGDWCTIHLVGPGGSLERLAVAHVDPEKLELARRLRSVGAPDPDAPMGPPRVVRTGEAELVEGIKDDLLRAAAGSEEEVPALRALGFSSFLSVPMKARGKVLGVISFVVGESARHYGPGDLDLAQGLADRAAVAIENTRLYAELVDADRRKDEFLATLAHELRNPLAPIRNSLQILGMPGADREVVERTRTMMERQVQHLVRLVDDLLDVSRVMRGKVELQRQRVDLATVFAHAVETAQPLIDTHRHELAMSIAERRVEVDGDPVRLTQVVANLLTNAAKYTAPGGRIHLTLAEENGAAAIRVRDDGMGIPPDMLAKVFDLFVQGDNSVARSAGGLGIGLTLVRSLVALHGGTVEARSDGPGTGSEFVITLPLGGPLPAAATAAGSREGARSLPSRRVLVVDDNADAAESLAMLLRLGGHAVAVAGDGVAALDLAGEHLPQIVLLDLGMPLMDGYEVARRLRGLFADGILLVALTGWGQEEDRRRSAAAGFDLHLVKPVEPGDLERLLAHPKFSDAQPR